MFNFTIMQTRKYIVVYIYIQFSSVHFTSVAQSCLTLWEPMDCSMPGFPVHHQIPEFTQTHVHSVGDAVQPSHLRLSPSLPAFIFPSIRVFQMSQLFTSDGQSIGVSALESVLPMNIQNWFPLGWTGWISLQSKGVSRVFSNTTVRKHQFFWTQLSLKSNSRLHIRLLEKKLFCQVAVSFNFKAAVTICSDFGAQNNKVCHCFQCFPIYLPWNDGTRCHDLRFLNVIF